VIRMIAWIPLLGRNGLVNKGLQGVGLIQQPLEWLLFSEFSVVLALVHLFTFFMVVPIFNSMIRIDKRLIEAAYDAGATGWQTLVNIIIPLAKPGIVIGSIFVITIVMGDFVTIGVMGGQQIASAGKIIEARLNALQFPAAAANAVILLGITNPDYFGADAGRRYSQGAVRWARSDRVPFMFWLRFSPPTCCFYTGRCSRSTSYRFRDPMAA
jgi:putative spermidine/putrescine transport system permease protein